MKIQAMNVLDRVTTIDSLSTEIKIILPEEHTSFSEDLQTTTNRSYIYGHIHMLTNAGIFFLELYTIYAKCFLIRTVSHLSKRKKSWKYYPPQHTHTKWWYQLKCKRKKFIL